MLNMSRSRKILLELIIKIAWSRSRFLGLESESEDSTDSASRGLSDLDQDKVYFLMIKHLRLYV